MDGGCDAGLYAYVDTLLREKRLLQTLCSNFSGTIYDLAKCQSILEILTPPPTTTTPR